MISSEVVIHKVSSKDGTPLYRAGIRFMDAQGNVVAEGYTDQNGIFSTTLTYGEYTWEEFQAPEGFILDPTPHKVTTVSYTHLDVYKRQPLQSTQSQSQSPISGRR